MKVSIISVALNSAAYIEDCIESVVKQDYEDIEYIVIDGGSTDGTIEIIKRYEEGIVKWISEPDRGIYDAMNKGIKAVTGDVIGILNSDDIYVHDSVITIVMSYLSKDMDTCYGDLVYVDRNDTNKRGRYWKPGPFIKDKFKRGWMPPHPTYFVKRKIYEEFGLFDINFQLAADYELMLRFLYINNVSTIYIPECLVKMRAGGYCRPGLTNTINNMQENYRAWKVNGRRPNPLTFLMKPLLKTLQYIKKY